MNKLGMAYNRQLFKSKIRNSLIGSIGEYCKYKLSLKNGFTKWTEHWNKEYQSLLNIAVIDVVTHTIRGFSDRRKVIDDVIKSIKSEQDQLSRIATHTICKDYLVGSLKYKLLPEDFNEFWVLATSAIDFALSTDI